MSFFYKIFRNFAAAFKGKRIFLHIAAIAATYLLVIFGADWSYYQALTGSTIAGFMFSAVLLGFFMPIIVPAAILAAGALKNDRYLMSSAWAVAQAAFLGWLTSSLYKVFSGRAHPNLNAPVSSDITRIFKFGIYRGGIFWGWPSSHTTVAFAMALTLWKLYPNNRWTRFLSLIYALYIGIGVSMTIHWFSDFIAGSLIGIAIGLAVGESFLKRPLR